MIYSTFVILYTKVQIKEVTLFSIQQQKKTTLVVQPKNQNR